MKSVSHPFPHMSPPQGRLEGRSAIWRPFVTGYRHSRGVMPTFVRDKLAEIASATVSDLSGASIAFSSLYQGGGAVVMLVRRLG